VVLLAYLMASPGFAVIDGALATMGGTVRAVGRPVGEGARGGARVGAPNRGGGDGVPPNPLPGATPRAGFDPASTTIAGRDQAKAAELGVSLRTVQTRRATAFCLGSRKPQRRAEWP